jgi:hypothetical protein
MLGRAVFVLCVLVGSSRAEIQPPSVATFLAKRPECVVPVSSRAEPDTIRGYDLGRPTEHAQPTTLGTSRDDRGVAVAFMLMGLCTLAFAITRGNAVRRTFATSRHFADADLVQLQSVAYAQRARTAWFACACGIVLLAIASLPIEHDAQMMLAVPPAMLLAIAIVALRRLQILIGLRPEPCLRVMAHGPYLFAARGKRLVGWVGATPSMIARASGLPTATARRV